MSVNQRLFGYEHAFDHDVTVWLTVFGAVLLAIAPLLIFFMSRLRGTDVAHRVELRKRYLSWLVLAPMTVVPVLLGAFWTILSVMLLSLLCYREYARVTGCFRDRLISLVVVVGILLDVRCKLFLKLKNDVFHVDLRCVLTTRHGVVSYVHCVFFSTRTHCDTVQDVTQGLQRIALS